MVPVPTSLATAMPPPGFTCATAPADSAVIWSAAPEFGGVRASTTPCAMSAT